ncbi:HNH endonuclease family protein [Streptomyces sp. NPDC056191]|uniref:HNH endonuclease family protein n=1 Tax=Streptomyces sp. NPDC056191 TaxID=3345742 RepID=UPI0035DB2F52
MTETILSVLSSVTDGSIVLQPTYQRRAFWDRKKKSALIESVFLGLPLPLIYLADAEVSIDGEQVPVREVVDGQQRLTSLKEFYDGALTIPEDSVVEELRGKRFVDLKPILKATFKNFKLSTATIPINARADKFELFKRLNQKSTVLSDQELRNAVHHSDYLTQIKEHAEKLKEKLRVSEAEWKRMKDVEYLSRLLAYQRRGYMDFPNKRLNQFLNDEMSVGKAEDAQARDRRCKLIDKALDRVMDVFGDLRFRPYRIPDHSFGEWARTLNRALMEAQVWAFLDHSRYGFKDAGAFDRAIKDRRQEIIDAVQRLHAYNERFNDAIQRGTTGKPNVEFRFSRYEAAVRVALSGVPEGRRQRFFTLQQKQNLWDRTPVEDRKCSECDHPIRLEESEVDHIKPFAEGGETVEDNGQLLHRACNRAKGARWDPIEDVQEADAQVVRS